MAKATPESCCQVIAGDEDSLQPVAHPPDRQPRTDTPWTCFPRTPAAELLQKGGLTPGFGALTRPGGRGRAAGAWHGLINLSQCP